MRSRAGSSPPLPITACGRIFLISGSGTGSSAARARGVLQRGAARSPQPAAYADQLRTVWKNVASVAAPDAQLIVRFGGIADRKADPLSIVKSSVRESGWKIATVKPAGSAASGKRQSLHFARTSTAAKDEYDVWARRA